MVQGLGFELPCFTENPEPRRPGFTMGMVWVLVRGLGFRV